MPKQDETVVLKNGIQESEAYVRSVMKDLRKLWEDEPAIFRDFFLKCKSRAHAMQPASTRHLMKMGLCLENQHPNIRILYIVKCAVAEEGAGFRIRSPFRE